MDSRTQLLNTMKKRGCRDPNDPFKTLKPSHNYCKLRIKRMELENKIDFERKPKESEIFFKQIQNIDRKIEKFKK